MTDVGTVRPRLVVVFFLVLAVVALLVLGSCDVSADDGDTFLTDVVVLLTLPLDVIAEVALCVLPNNKT